MANFNQAIKWLKEGKKVRRSGLGFAFDTDYITLGVKDFQHCRSSEEGIDWSLIDFEAEDWEIFEEKKIKAPGVFIERAALCTIEGIRALCGTDEEYSEYVKKLELERGKKK